VFADNIPGIKLHIKGKTDKAVEAVEKMLQAILNPKLGIKPTAKE